MNIKKNSEFILKCLACIAVLSGFASETQAQLKITYSDDSRCRMHTSELKPIITPNNPFFNTHIWADDSKTEIAELSPDRTVQIIQEACLRHHARIRLSILPEAVSDPKDLNFYVAELFNLMNRIYFYDVDYSAYRLEFENLFIKNLSKNGLNTEFNFLISDYTFLCSLEGGNWGASINMEIVKLIHNEEIELPGVKEYTDDGHFQTNLSKF